MESETAVFVRAALVQVLGQLPEDGDVDLWEAGLMTSYTVIETITVIEDGLGVTFDVPSMKAENFRSIHAITALIDRLVPAGPA